MKIGMRVWKKAYQDGYEPEVSGESVSVDSSVDVEWEK